LDCKGVDEADEFPPATDLLKTGKRRSTTSPENAVFSVKKAVFVHDSVRRKTACRLDVSYQKR